MGGGAEELCEKVISVTCRKNGPIITDNCSSVWHVGEMAGGESLTCEASAAGRVGVGERGAGRMLAWREGGARWGGGCGWGGAVGVGR